ncbi:scavenger receptor cysteine-rich type 1 protein M160-like [Halichondria panicea]|uniref:scavenger receptor cysteine-rich type 1 protein M160-like n=1 Tax=Halichondria panicea TaxID=6063 RepID=UPI00312B64F0
MSCLLWKSITLLSLVWAVGGQSSGDLRLVGNSSQTGGSSGRLEFYYNGQWGTVCQDSFSPNDARVACRQLGFSSYSRYETVGRLGFSSASSTTRTWLDELRCLGTESRLTDCLANPIGYEDCVHSEDVALICTESTASPNGDLRLVGRSGQTGGSSGRLDVYFSGQQWGTVAVCEDNFGSSEAKVACRQLGFSSYTRYGKVIETLGFYPPTSITRTWLDELRCRGTESRLIECPNTIGVEDCTRFETIALICTESSVSSVSIGIGVAVPVIIIIFVVVIIILFCVIIRRRRLNRPSPRTLNTNTTSTAATVTNTQNTAYSMNQRSSNSNQSPWLQPTGQYAASSLHRTSYPQQPPAAYSQQSPAPYFTREPPSAPYPTAKPPPAQLSTPLKSLYSSPLYFSGGEAPPPYPG